MGCPEGREVGVSLEAGKRLRFQDILHKTIDHDRELLWIEVSSLGFRFRAAYIGKTARSSMMQRCRSELHLQVPRRLRGISDKLVEGLDVLLVLHNEVRKGTASLVLHPSSFWYWASSAVSMGLGPTALHRN